MDKRLIELVIVYNKPSPNYHTVKAVPIHLNYKFLAFVKQRSPLYWLEACMGEILYCMGRKTFVVDT